MPESVVDALVDGGKATAGPPLGPALGPLGVNTGEIVSAINEKTKDFAGMQVPVKVIVKKDKSFDIEVGSPPVSALIKKELGMKKGTGKGETAGDLPMEWAVKIARMKIDSMLSNDIKAATKEVIGSCVPLGVLVEGKKPQEAQKEIDEGKWDEVIDGKERELDVEAIKEKNKQLQANLDKKPEEEDTKKKGKKK